MVLARRKRAIKRMKKPLRLRKKARRRRAKPPPSRGFQYRTLVAIVMLLYMLRLIDKKTFNRMTGSPYPKRAGKKRRRRRRAR